MDNKRIVAALVVLMLMVAGIFILVRNLYTVREPHGSVRAESPYSRLFGAVPPDAALVFCLDGSGASRRIAADSTGVFRAFAVPGPGKSLQPYLAMSAAERTVVSLHNSGSLVPLVLTALPGADSARLAPYVAAAAAVDLKTSYDANAGLLLASRSETLVGTAQRHLSSGNSILQTPGFSQAVSALPDGNLVYVRGAGASKLYQVFAAQSRRKHAGLAAGVADWLVLDMKRITPEGLALSGAAIPSERNYLRIFSGKAQAEPAFPEVLPSGVRSVFSVVVPDLDGYLEGYARYCDVISGRKKLDDKWVRHLSVREAAIATLPDGARLMLVRAGAEPDSWKGIRPDVHAGQIAACFGGPFTSFSDSLCLKVGKWLVYGPETALESLPDGPRLKSLLSEAGLSLTPLNGVSCYAAVTGTLLGDLFSPETVAALTPYVQGVPLVPAVLSAGMSSGRETVSLRLARCVSRSEDKPLTALSDTVVLVPAGPFPVKNSATGKENTLYQNSAHSICLKDENGKDQWGIPFKETICGRVQTIDYYANGRLQFLFAAGTKLYLLDRLGRFVNGFPVSLGREVLLGPDVYDFSGASGYRVMILHKDNTLSLYNLHGQKPDNWKDIAPSAPVKGLPSYVQDEDGKHYWLVPTSVGTAVYGFYGGDPLPKKEAARVLKRMKING